MEKIQYSKRARHVFILVVLFIILGVLISAGGEMTAQPSLPGPIPSGVAERLWYLDADGSRPVPDEFNFVYVDRKIAGIDLAAATNVYKTFSAVADTMISEGHPDLNFGSEPDMWTGYWNTDVEVDKVRGLVRFDINSIPSDVTVTSANLVLYMGIAHDNQGNVARPVTTYRITDNWDEMAASWNNAPAYDNTAYGSASIKRDDLGEYSFDVTTLVAGWVDGTYDNNGILLIGPEAAINGAVRGFATLDNPIEGTRPRLEIEYKLPPLIPTDFSYLPVIAMNYPVISGFVVDQLNQKLENVLIQTDQGPSTTTDASGFYMFDGLPSGVYELKPILEGYKFAPETRSASIPKGAVLQNFVGEKLPPTATPTPTNTPTNTPMPTNTPTATNTPSTNCSNLIVNGDFESNTAWILNNSQYPASYSTVQSYSPSRSMRTGIIVPGPNIESSSSTIQQVSIPAGATQATLDFWLYTESSDPPFLSTIDRDLGFTPMAATIDYDAQVVIVYEDISLANELARLVVSRLNEKSWKHESHDLTSFAGQTIVIYFGSNNNGQGGVTGMYVDDVSLEVCAPN